jgi:hypothetical protein
LGVEQKRNERALPSEALTDIEIFWMLNKDEVSKLCLQRRSQILNYFGCSTKTK